MTLDNARSLARLLNEAGLVPFFDGMEQADWHYLGSADEQGWSVAWEAGEWVARPLDRP